MIVKNVIRIEILKKRATVFVTKSDREDSICVGIRNLGIFF